MNGTGASQRTSESHPDPRIHPQNAAAFNRLDLADQEAILALSGELKLSLQTEREFLEWLPEIAYLAGQTVAMILESDDIRASRESQVLNAPQKIEKIRSILFSRRFPRYDKTLEQWKQLSRKTFARTPGVAVLPDPYFEKSKIELRITLSGADEACDVMAKLAAIPKGTWASLIDPTRAHHGENPVSPK